MNLPTDYHETIERTRAQIERIDEILSESYCYRCRHVAPDCHCGIFRNLLTVPADSKITTTTK